ncbi:MAG: hypothetical protein U0Y68_13900 [Blastocatellia bacterium]
MPYLMPLQLSRQSSMTFTLELFDTPEILQVLAECWRVLQPGGRIAIAGMSKEDENGVLLHVFEWTHQHFPNFLDCRPIFVQRAFERTGYPQCQKQTMWVPVEIILAQKPGGLLLADGKQQQAVN